MRPVVTAFGCTVLAAVIIVRGLDRIVDLALQRLLTGRPPR